MRFERVMDWANDNGGFLGLVALLLSLTIVTVSVILWARKRKPTTEHALREQRERAEKWRRAFTNYLETIQAKGPPDDIPVIIRDMMRVSKYPERGHEAGISSFSKVWLVDTYHDGILVSLGCLQATYIKAIEDNKNWYYCDCDDPDERHVHLLGKIPFDRIEQVNWRGDEYDYCPHVYCRFDSPLKEPYSELVYCEQVDRPDGWPYYRDVVRLQDMRNTRIC